MRQAVTAEPGNPVVHKLRYFTRVRLCICRTTNMHIAHAPLAGVRQYVVHHQVVEQQHRRGSDRRLLFGQGAYLIECLGMIARFELIA